MQDVVLSLNKNLLKVSTIYKNNFASLSVEVSASIVMGSKVVDAQAFAGILKELINKLLPNSQKYYLNFVVEPSDTILCFVTIPKSDSILSESIIKEIKDKFADIDLDNSYYSYEKIAPFVYQFIGAKKEYIEKIIEVSDIIDAPIKSIIPWIAALPKYVSTCDPAIFVYGGSDKYVVALSEMGGIFFINEYANTKTTQEIDKLVLELSIYKRLKPIKFIYTLNYVTGNYGDEYVVKKVDFQSEGVGNIEGFETNLLVHYVLDSTSDILNTQVNLVTILPLPAVEKNNTSVIKYASIGAITVAAVFLVFLGFAFGLKALKNNHKTTSTTDTANQVLSESTAPKETTDTEKPVEPPAKELKKSDLTIRIENGSGINGMAAKTKTSLEGFGYKIAEIDTAQKLADKTMVSFKKDKVEYSSLLSADMKAGFGDVAIDQNLPVTVDYDVLITIGGNVSL